MRESVFRRRVVQVLHEVGAFSVENQAWPGTPDVACSLGWLELKVLRGWPKRGGPFRVPHFTVIQRVWHSRWAKAGGRSWVLIRIGREVLLFSGTDARQLGHWTEAETRQRAVAVWRDVEDMGRHLHATLAAEILKPLPEPAPPV